MLYGKEDLCSLPRDLTSIELFTNQEFYPFHPYVKEKSAIFQTENSAFSATASDNALGNGYDRTNPSTRTSVVMREALQNAVNGTFSSLLCMFALASVTGMNIASVYLETSGEQTKYSKFLNGVIPPRAAHMSFKSHLSQDVELIILWSTDGIAILPGLDPSFKPNHFVPLVQFQPNIKQNESGVKKHKKNQPKITDIFKGTANKFVISKGKCFGMLV